ncbi:bifunctional folylpolyglutamate synthase/dihydrofolate synthase [bacterium]
MNYTQAIDYLFSRRQKGMKLGLERMETLLHLLDHPEKMFKTIHIAGTNGKGSTAAMMASILQAAGYQTGLYTSPHLIDMRERIQIQGIMISEKQILKILNKMKPHIEATEASFFEVITAMAFVNFADQNIDIAVVETGLGGRLDATNTLTPILTIITEIGLDHTKILGKTLYPIAAEKAGIFKSGVPCVVGSRNSSVNAFFQVHAEKIGCPVHFAQKLASCQNVKMTETGSWSDITIHNTYYHQLYLRLLGDHQIHNLTTALVCMDILQKMRWSITEEAVRTGLDQVQWPARLQLLQTQPKILLDSAHNPLGAKQLVKAIKTIFHYQKLILIFGVLEDKDYRAMLKVLLPLADQLILTQPLSDRALSPKKLEHLPILKSRISLVEPDIKKAWQYALSLANPEDMICGAGSIYFVGELLRLWKEINVGTSS